GKDLGVGPEPDDGPGAVGLAHRLDAGLGHAPLVLLLVNLAAAVHPDLQPLAQEVDSGDADAVEAGRHLVAAAPELAARVEPRHDQLERRQAFLLVDVDGDAPAVIVDLDAA